MSVYGSYSPAHHNVRLIKESFEALYSKHSYLGGNCALCYNDVLYRILSLTSLEA